jgi:hypothetical protein
MWMFWAFKLIFEVDILAFFGHFFPNIRQNFIQLFGHTTLVETACLGKN